MRNKIYYAVSLDGIHILWRNFDHIEAFVLVMVGWFLGTEILEWGINCAIVEL